MTKLTHLDPEGRPVMVDVSPKAITCRVAVAAGYLELDEPAAQALAQVGGPQGRSRTVARIGAVGVKHGRPDPGPPPGHRGRGGGPPLGRLESEGLAPCR